MRNVLVIRKVLCAVLVLVAACGGGGGDGPTIPASVLTTLEFTAAANTVASGSSVTTNARALDQFGKPMTAAFSFSTADANIATVDASGTVTGVRTGTTVITAAAGARSSTASITVTPGPAAALSIIRPAAGALNGGAFTTQPRVAIVDAVGNIVTTDNNSVVTLAIPTAAATFGTLAQTVSAGVATFGGVGIRGVIGTAHVLTYRSGTLPAVVQQVAVQPFSFSNGTRLVGTAVLPKLYRSVNPVSALCYWARLRNLSGADDIIANDAGGGPRLLEVVATDVAIQSSGCADWTEVIGGITTSLTGPFSDGSYLVGGDIQPGTWQASGSTGLCYWARLRDARSDLGSILANNAGTGPALVAIQATDFAFTSSGCGTWTRVP